MLLAQGSMKVGGLDVVWQVSDENGRIEFFKLVFFLSMYMHTVTLHAHVNVHAHVRYGVHKSTYVYMFYML